MGFLDLQKALHKFLSHRECQNLQNQWARGTLNIIAVRLVIKYHISPPLVMVGAGSRSPHTHTATNTKHQHVADALAAAPQHSKRVVVRNPVTEEGRIV